MSSLSQKESVLDLEYWQTLPHDLRGLADWPLTPSAGRVAGISAWVACALAMAAGEYVSVATQKDCEEADIQKERDMQAKGPEFRCGGLSEYLGIGHALHCSGRLWIFSEACAPLSAAQSP